MKKFIKFTESVTYPVNVHFLKDNVYHLTDKPSGFVNRWLKRGHIELSEEEVGDLKVLPDPREVSNLVVETPVDETPVDETPVDETPVDETPVDETPVDETKSKRGRKPKNSEE